VSASSDVYDADLTKPVALVVGNEAWGFSEGTPEQLDETVAIPMPGPMESLNAAVAGSLLLFEAVRQRRKSPS
jgi:tRNA G18 (ribose-2'-O)-methylase SpoU